ncbi:MAG: methyltransferase domain-containing protein, partial [Pseudomonadota bacterium]
MSEALSTRDQPAPGLVVYQPRRGFRYAMDPFLLAAWSLEGGSPVHAVDLGCGSGIMALLLARLGVQVQGFDVRPEWVALARRSAADSGLSVAFELADVRALDRPPADLALLNPPYLAAGRGHPSPDPWKAAARTELNGTLAELIAAGARLGARLCVVL